MNDSQNRCSPDSEKAAALIARADKYLNTGSGEYASDIMRDMAEFIRRGCAVAPAAAGNLDFTVGDDALKRIQDLQDQSFDSPIDLLTTAIRIARGARAELRAMPQLSTDELQIASRLWMERTLKAEAAQRWNNRTPAQRPSVTGDTIHNLGIVRQALECEGLAVHVKLVDGAIEDISLLGARGDLAVQNRNYWQGETNRLRGEQQPAPATEVFANLAEGHVGAARDLPTDASDAYDMACRDIASAIRDAAFAAPPQAWLEAKAEVDAGWPDKGDPPEPTTARETCVDCGHRNPCDEDCPNHIDPPILPQTAWRPIETAPRDETPVLLKLKDRIPSIREDLRRWDGIMFVGKYHGLVMDWSFAAPVGQGGFPDEWMEGWKPVALSRPSQTAVEKTDGDQS